MKKKCILLLLALSVSLTCMMPVYAYPVSRENYPHLQAANASGTWHQDDHGWWFEYVDGGSPKSNWEFIDGNWYYFDDSGYILTDWQNLNGHWYYFDQQGAMVTGWQTIGGQNFYFEESASNVGTMVTGWRSFSDKGHWWSYFNPGTGACEIQGQYRKGCRHGKMTYSDRVLSSGREIGYRYWGKKFNSQITAGADAWNHATDIIHFQESENRAINIYDSKLEPSYAAVTRVTVGYQSESGPAALSKNWTGVEIHLNTRNESAVSSGTVAHELGHGLGLDHRGTDASSIMYRDRAKTGILIPQRTDVDTVAHLYQGR